MPPSPSRPRSPSPLAVAVRELRGHSRRGRTFLLRVGYLVALASLILLAAPETPSGSPSAGMQATARVEMGKSMVASLAWFQFVVGQVLAVVLLAGSFREELSRRTFLPMMTTPLTSGQIVIGKLLGRLGNAMLLMLVGLPVLMVLRLMGGVTWGYVLGSAALTMTAMFTMASATLQAATRHTSMVAVIAHAVLRGMVVPGVLALGAIIVEVAGVPGAISTAWSPVAMARLTAEMFRPTGAGWLTLTAIWVHVLAYAGYSVWMLHRAAVDLRRVALPEAIGRTPLRRFTLHDPEWIIGSVLNDMASQREAARKGARSRRRRRAPTNPSPAGPAEHAAPKPDTRLAEAAAALVNDDGPPVDPETEKRRRLSKLFGALVGQIGGSPVAWHARRTSLLPADGPGRILAIGAMAVLVSLYGTMLVFGGLARTESQKVYFVCCVLAVWAACGVSSAALVCPERENGTLEGLLSTPMTGRRILLGKVAGVWKRLKWVLAVFWGHLLLAVFAGALPLLSIGMLVLTMVGMTLLTTGLGMYVATRCRRTHVAVLWTLGLTGVAWLGVPLAGAGAPGSQTQFAIRAASPVYQVIAASQPDMIWPSFTPETPPGSVRGIPVFDWAGSQEFRDRSALIVAACSGVYALASVGLFAMAARRIRRV